MAPPPLMPCVLELFVVCGRREQKAAVRHACPSRPCPICAGCVPRLAAKLQKHKLQPERLVGLLFVSADAYSHHRKVDLQDDSIAVSHALGPGAYMYSSAA